MRFLRIFLLNFQRIFEHRTRSFVWLLVSLFNPLLFILFWRGAFEGRKEIAAGVTLTSLTAYYFLLTVIGAFLSAHIEESVAFVDIQEGKISAYLLKPFSYYWSKFFEEIPYRILQGFYGIIILLALRIIFGSFLTVTDNLPIIVLALFTMILAYLLSFTMKIVLGVLAFWFTEMRAIFQVAEAIILIFAGYIMPLVMLPDNLKKLADNLPFAYVIYYPVVIIQGKVQIQTILRVMLIQIFWLFFFILLFKILWRRGLMKFTALGQ